MGSQTTRIDFHRINVNAQTPGTPVRWGYMVRFYTQGWDYAVTSGDATTPYRTETDPPMRGADGRTRPFDLETTLAQLEMTGWTVRRWRASDAGVSARAWRGPASPVRTREQIIALRRRQSARLAESHGQVEPQHTTFIDYAYEG